VPKAIQPNMTQQAADGADAGIKDKSAKPKAADAVDAGIKYSDLPVPGFMTLPVRRVVVVRRKSRRPKMARGPFENSPF
jgi:hypothetical protein